MRARVAQATVRVWVEGRDDPCSLTVLVDPEGVDLSRPECFSPRAFMKSPSIYKRVRVRGLSLRAERSNLASSIDSRVLSPSYPDVLMAFRRRSPDDSAVGHSAPPGSRSAPPAHGTELRSS